LSYCKWYAVCPMNFFYSDGQIEKDWIDNYCYGDWETCVRYQLEEAGKYHPDYMLPDGTIDESLQ